MYVCMNVCMWVCACAVQYCAMKCPNQYLPSLCLIKKKMIFSTFLKIYCLTPSPHHTIFQLLLPIQNNGPKFLLCIDGLDTKSFIYFSLSLSLSLTHTHTLTFSLYIFIYILQVKSVKFPKKRVFAKISCTNL